MEQDKTDVPINDLLDCARYGELDDIKAFVDHVLSTRHDAPDGRASFLGVKGFGGNTMMHMASANGHLDLIRYLLATGPLPETEMLNAANDEGNTPVHWAALNGHVAIVEYLVSNGCDAKTRNLNGQSPLFIAQAYGREEVEATLLKLVDYESEDEEDDDEEMDQVEQEDIIVSSSDLVDEVSSLKLQQQ